MAETLMLRQGAPVRWAKVVDHTRCIGCHACSAACKSEGSVPHQVTSGDPSAPNNAAAAFLSYDVPHRAPWDWRVSLYTWTKGIAAGAWLVAALLLLAGPGDRYADVSVDTAKARRAYEEWMSRARPAVLHSPDGTRRPYWLLRPLKPGREAYKLPGARFSP